MIGKTLSHFRIVETLGAGGMGVVYRAHDEQLDRDVAIKVLPSESFRDPSSRARLVREARTASKLNHPHICTIYEVGEHEGQAFIAMELVEGRSLSALLEGGALPTEQVQRYGIQLADALAHAHERGIVHRDLKSANVIVTPDGRAKVLDFGLAKRQSTGELSETATRGMDTLTAPGMVVGTLAYMAPEQLRGDTVDARTDIWAAGAVLYEAATGRRPFTAKTASALAGDILHAPVAPPRQLHPDLSARLEGIILRCLEKDAANRYQTAEELLADLRRLASSGAASVFPLSRPRRYLWATLLGGVVIAAGFFAWRWQPYRPPEEAARWYDRGVTAMRDGSYYSGARMFERAVSIEKQYALAHARLAEAATELDDGTRAKQELLLAMPPAGPKLRFSRRDAAYMDAIYRTVTGDYSGAVSVYDRIMRDARPNERLDAKFDLARALEKAGKTREALAIYEEITREQPQFPAPWLRKGILSSRQGNYRGALDAFAQASNNYLISNNLEGTAEVLYWRGLVEGRFGRYADAEASLQKALRMAQDSADLRLQILCLTQLSFTDYNQGDTASAEQLAARAVELARAKGVENLTVRTMLDLGNVYVAKGNYQKAETWFTESLNLARSFHAESSEARALLSLGSLAIQQSKLQEGISFIERALPYYERVHMAQETMLGQVLLARAVRDRGDYQRALELFDSVLGEAVKQGDKRSEQFARDGLSSTLAALDRLPEALEVQKQLYADLRPTGTQIAFGYSCLMYGQLLQRLGRQEEARQRFQEAGELAAKAGYRALSDAVAIQLVELSARQGRLAEAALQASKALKDSLSPDNQIRAKIALAKVFAATRRGQDAVKVALEALDASRLQPSARLQLDTALDTSEVLLTAGEPRRALEILAPLTTGLEKTGQLESRWRASAMASLAAGKLGNRAQAAEFAALANGIFIQLQQKWGAAFAQYKTRPDIQAVLKDLASVGS